MTREEFISEVKSSNYNYPSFDEEYKGFQEYQNLVGEMLKEFHRICESNGIHYQLAYGSMIGAVRDGGQIPWDYDADVLVPYSEKGMLIEVLKKDLNKKYYYMCPESDPRCRHYFIKIAPVGYKSASLHLDVFYSIGAPDHEPLEFGKDIRQHINLRYIKLVNIREELAGNIKDQILMLLRKIKYQGLSQGKIDSEFESLCKEYDSSECKNLLVTDFYADRQLFHSEMWETNLIKTYNGDFRIACCYDRILTELYGDYKSVPPLKDRIDEFRKSYQRIKRMNRNMKIEV